MKTLFIEAKYKEKIILGREIIKRLPDKIGLVSTVQFIDNLKNIKKSLEENNKKIYTAKSDKLKYPGQVLGCDVSAANKIKNNVDCFLYVGDGKFHPLEIAMKTDKLVFTFNPFTERIEKISKEEIDKFNKKKKINYMKFLHADSIGVLVSVKPGQKYNMENLEKLKKKFNNKKFYIFIFNTLNINELENFPFIECFVNTACQRLIEDIEKPVVNISEIR